MTAINTRRHKTALSVFLAIVIAHWGEHVAQAVQIYAFGWPLPQARGLLGVPFPWLVTSEWMHYGYALIMVAALAMLRPGFSGLSRSWWTASLVIQLWHHLEHLLLLGQALTGLHLLGRPVPTSLLQLAIPRVELHLFYNAVVTIPMIVAMILHRRPTMAPFCTCAPARA